MLRGCYGLCKKNEADRQTGRLTDWQTGRLADWQTGRQTRSLQAETGDVSEQGRTPTFLWVATLRRGDLPGSYSFSCVV